MEHKLRTWIEIDKSVLLRNFGNLKRLTGPRVRFMAVIKSNAYGHGLAQVAKALLRAKNFNERGWFGVDSIVEATRLRREGIMNPILVLGYTLPSRIADAEAGSIAISVSSFDALSEVLGAKKRPAFHLKFDTGMHRQGFFPADAPRVIRHLKRAHAEPEGIFTHFASAKDETYPAYTLIQKEAFKKVCARFKRAGFRGLIRHAAASGGTLLFPDTHFDMVRVGMALYGYYPSSEVQLQRGKKVKLLPVLAWKAVVGEVKKIPKGSYVGYDLTERVNRDTKMAVIPIGYWHGFDRGFSSVGEVLIGGRRRKVLGRVSMDMIVVDVSDAPRAASGDEVVLIGRQGKERMGADELGAKIGTSAYEILTRLNPLIKRI